VATENISADTTYDVVICGAGLAGLALARQLKLELPQLTVAVIDRLSAPLPEAAHKVGESTNEMAGYYFGRVLRLDSYLTTRHLIKKGSLRFFFGDSHGPFEERPELGVRVSPPIHTYQLDRGRLENDLRQMVVDMGVRLIEDSLVEDVVMGEGVRPHAVQCRRRKSGEHFTLSGRWLVDALGRRRFLESKLGLMQPNDHCASAAWWRIDARIDVQDMGAGWRWRRRVEHRYLSTNHLMGRGYWVWLIPLSSGATSIGIVTDETIHPFLSYGKSYAHALEWLRNHEPAVLPLIDGHEPMDFLGLKNYSYHSRQIFSHQRWSCVGDAGLFLDPLYSLGSDFIAIENTITTEMIRRDLAGELTEDAVEEFNRLVLDLLAPQGLAYFKDTYRIFGHGHIFTAKLAWDTAIYWAMLGPLFFQGIVRRPTPEVLAILRRYNELHLRVERLLSDWAEKAPRRVTFSHADIARMRFHQLLYLELTTRRTEAQFLAGAKLNLDRLEEMAQILFWQAVKECFPEHANGSREHPPWINAWRISLAPERWEADGLYEPTSAPRDLRSMRRTFAGVFGPMTVQDIIQVELFYRLVVAQRKPLSSVIQLLHRRLIRDKPAMWLRRFFIMEPRSIVEPRSPAGSSTPERHPG
jgi:flavin-dependent dehydrogenase